MSLLLSNAFVFCMKQHQLAVNNALDVDWFYSQISKFISIIKDIRQITKYLKLILKYSIKVHNIS